MDTNCPVDHSQYGARVLVNLDELTGISHAEQVTRIEEVTERQTGYATGKWSNGTIGAADQRPADSERAEPGEADRRCARVSVSIARITVDDDCGNQVTGDGVIIEGSGDLGRGWSAGDRVSGRRAYDPKKNRRANNISDLG